MLNVTSYIHPIRTYLPCTGVGRHINNILLGLAYDDDINLELICSKQWIKADGKLDMRSPLREIPLKTFPFPVNFLKWINTYPNKQNGYMRLWKLIFQYHIIQSL
jgi:hypothetical protein